jgi:hypothetical protein
MRLIWSICEVDGKIHEEIKILQLSKLLVTSWF